MITMFKKACAAVLIGFAWAAVAAAPFGDSSTAFAGDTNTDTNHYALIRIGHGEPLPAFRNIVVGLNKSTVVEVPRDLRDVVVSNPAILDAVVQSSSRVYLIGKALGQGNVIFFDENGEQILTLEVRIEHDVQAFDRLIERVIPGAKVKSEVLNDTIVLTGSVPNPADAARVADIASRFIQSPGDANGRSPIKVVNLLKAEAKEQVLLKVQVAEVNRETIKRLGVNWNYGHVGDSALGFMTNNGFPVSNGTGSDQFLFGVTGPGDDLSQCLIPGAAAALAPVASVPAGANFNCLARTMQAFERNGLLIVAPEFSNQNFPKSWAYNLGNVVSREAGGTLRPTPESTWSFPIVDRIFEQVRQQTGSRRTGFAVVEGEGTAFVLGWPAEAWTAAGAPDPE